MQSKNDEDVNAGKVDSGPTLPTLGLRRRRGNWKIDECVMRSGFMASDLNLKVRRINARTSNKEHERRW
jgi:hypothetical protein